MALICGGIILSLYFWAASLSQSWEFRNANGAKRHSAWQKNERTMCPLTHAFLFVTGLLSVSHLFHALFLDLRLLPGGQPIITPVLGRADDQLHEFAMVIHRVIQQ
jgi:hypothetical protein